MRINLYNNTTPAVYSSGIATIQRDISELNGLERAWARTPINGWTDIDIDQVRSLRTTKEKTLKAILNLK
jgi:hypothetical protein